MSESWPAAARKQARHLVHEYGAPHWESAEVIEWNNVGDWQRVRARRDGLVEETVAYSVPEKQVALMQVFEGQLFVDLYHQEVTAVGESEELNCLRLNLMHDVVVGKKTRGQAWERYQWSQQALSWHWPDLYISGLHFHTDTRYFPPTDVDHLRGNARSNQREAMAARRDVQPYAR